ncbi:MAG: chemotaxis-specific protein-glutamate methyltransferase CheB [bacterium]|nr:chemotaxis-specific protein-glutamate methyltransferase CheB [bacterium]
MLKILIAEENDLYRSVLKNIFVQIPGTIVSGSASDGKEALEKVNKLKPDLITIDVDLPIINGITLLRHIKKSYPVTKAIMMSTRSKANVRIAMEALSQGALDTVSLSDTKNIKQNFQQLQTDLTRIVKGFINLTGQPDVKPIIHGQIGTIPAAANEHTPVKSPLQFPDKKIIYKAIIEVVVIGISTGGPPALHKILPVFHKNINVPMIIVQHMPESFTQLLAETLNTKSRLKVVEAKTGDFPERGTVYIAPGEKQLKVMRDKTTGKVVLVTTDDPPENFCKPSADYLFRSVADVYGAKALGVIMTGMGGDGAKGLKIMKAKGSIVIAQDKDSSIVFGMPWEAIKLGIVDIVRPLDQIAQEITRVVRKSRG